MKIRQGKHKFETSYSSIYEIHSPAYPLPSPVAENISFIQIEPTYIYLLATGNWELPRRSAAVAA